MKSLLPISVFFVVKPTGVGKSEPVTVSSCRRGTFRGSRNGRRSDGVTDMAWRDARWISADEQIATFTPSRFVPA